MNEYLASKLLNNQPNIEAERWLFSINILNNQYFFLEFFKIHLDQDYPLSSQEFLLLTNLLNFILANIEEKTENYEFTLLPSTSNVFFESANLTDTQYIFNEKNFENDLEVLIQTYLPRQIESEYVFISMPTLLSNLLYHDKKVILTTNHVELSTLISHIKNKYIEKFQLPEFSDIIEISNLFEFLKNTWFEDVYKDLRFLLTLKPVQIPINNEVNIPYCIIDNNVGGVTEKLALISQDTLLKNLTELNKAIENLDDSDSYQNISQKFLHLETEAIIKLPKHGKISEIQHEFIALHIAKLLKFTTTQLYLISYENKPALFIPFDDIDLLTPFVSGQVNYSTLKPIGEGLISPKIFEDFSELFAYLYVCNDQDAVGKDGQNKGILNNQLYIFDQVFSFHQSLFINELLDLEPYFLDKQTRHTMGRNYSLFNDTDFSKKILSIKNILSSEKNILDWLDLLILTYTVTLRNKHLNKHDYFNILLFERDAKLIKEKIIERLNNIFEKFPTINHEKLTRDTFKENFEILNTCLFFTKLLNGCKLYSEYKQPYQEFVCKNISMPAVNINIYKDQDNDYAEIFFKHAIPEKFSSYLMWVINSQDISFTTNSVKANISTFVFLNNELHPEKNHHLDLGSRYLIEEKIKFLDHIYNPYEYRNSILNNENFQPILKFCLNKFLEYSVDFDNAVYEQIENIYDHFEKYTFNTKDTGIFLHLKKIICLYLEQQWIARFHPEEQLLWLDYFNFSIKLDRMYLYNKAHFFACKYNLTDLFKELLKFLNSEFETKKIKNYQEFVIFSQKYHAKLSEFLRDLQNNNNEKEILAICNHPSSFFKKEPNPSQEVNSPAREENLSFSMN